MSVGPAILSPVRSKKTDGKTVCPTTIKAMTASAPARRTVGRFFEYSLLGMLASGYLAVLASGYLDAPTAVIAFGALIVRALMIPGWIRFDLSGSVVAAATLLCLGFLPLDYAYVSRSFLPATIHLIFFLATIKLLTSTTPRDFRLLRIIAVLELLAAAVASVDVTFFGFLALFVLFAIATFCSSEVFHGLPSPEARSSVPGLGRRLAFVSVGLFSGILLMTAGMFFVLPRTARAAFQRLAPDRYHLPGFSNEVTLGEIGRIKQSSVPVMHVHAEQHPNAPGGMAAIHWRGAALSEFDGKRWFNQTAPEERLLVKQGVIILGPSRPLRPSHDFAYEVQLSDAAPDTLFFAGEPETIRIDLPILWRSTAGSIRVPRIRPGSLRYAAYSYLGDELSDPRSSSEPITEVERQQLLALPSVDPRIRQVALDFSALAATPEAKARAIEYHLRHDYGYTLELPSSAVADPLANFLFVRKKGHCEYFASAMAVMLRTIGVPSRVVTGFLGGVYNPMTDWQVIRASDAHSWVEAWIPGRGWMTFDPTPADPNSGRNSLWTKASLFFDAADQFWQDWVVGYDIERQVVLASRMRQSGGWRFGWMESAENWLDSALRLIRTHLLAVLVILLAGSAAILYGPSVLRRWRGFMRLRRAERGEGVASDATMLYERMLRLLEQRGFQKPPWLTPAEFSRVLPQSELALLAEDLTAAYNEFRFGGKREAAPKMVWLLQQMEALDS